MSKITRTKLARSLKTLVGNKIKWKVGGKPAQDRMGMENPLNPYQFVLVSPGQRINFSKRRNKIIYHKENEKVEKRGE
jgi:hypothetical protein